MPYPSPITYPSPTLYPGFTTSFGGRQIAFGDFVLGNTDPFGVSWSITKFDGWRGDTGSTLQLTQRARGRGSTASEPFQKDRVMVVEGLIHAPDAPSLEDAFDRITAAITLEPVQMLVSEAARVRGAMVQRQGATIPDYITDKLGHYSIQIVAKDDRKFGDLNTATTLLPASSGGRTYPAIYPITYTGITTTGVLRITNTGNTDAPVWLRIAGPIPAGGWTVTHVGKQKALAFSSSLALASGEFVTVDMDRKEVLAQGQSPRSGYVTSRGWFSLDPGDNDIAFSAANYSSTAQLTVTTKPAWA